MKNDFKALIVIITVGTLILMIYSHYMSINSDENIGLKTPEFGCYIVQCEGFSRPYPPQELEQ